MTLRIIVGVAVLLGGLLPAPVPAADCTTSLPRHRDGHWSYRIEHGRRCWYPDSAPRARSHRSRSAPKAEAPPPAPVPRPPAAPPPPAFEAPPDRVEEQPFSPGRGDRVVPGHLTTQFASASTSNVAAKIITVERIVHPPDPPPARRSDLRWLALIPFALLVGWTVRSAVRGMRSLRHAH